MEADRSARLRGAVAALLVLAGAALSSCSSPDAASSSENPSVDPIPVRVVAARARTVDRTVDLVGTLLASQEATVAAEAEGQVKEVLVDFGDRVEAGQVLARVDAELLAASLRQAEARARNAAADEARARALHAGGVVSPQEYDRLKTAGEVARAERDLLAIRLRNATVRAPIAGAVTARMIDVGDYARPASPLFTIVADRMLRLRGEIAERFVAELSPGLELRGEVDAVPGLTVRGKLARMNASVDPKSRSLTVEAEIDNSAGKLRPGFFVRGHVVTQRGVRTVTVPPSAILTVAGVSRVFVLSRDTASQREVSLGQRFEDEVEVLSGLEAGESVIASGLARLHHGALVRRGESGA